MKKSFIFIALISICAMAWAVLPEQAISNEKRSCKPSMENTCAADCIIKTNTADQDYVCSCGTKLKWSAKCFAYKKKCISCGGDGVLSSGEYKTKCTACDGKGWYWDYKSGHYCPSCGNKYSD